MTEDITGRKFGMLTAISRIENKNGRRRWLCRCDCGREKAVYEANLSTGHTKSCGCMRSPDITGQRFGKLTVVGPSNLRSKRGARTCFLWECRCDCGNITYKPKDSLTRQETSMCAECASKNGIACARAGAGYVDGTQISRIKSVTNTAANTSGCRGVYYDKRSNMYRARLRFKGKLMDFGTYSKYEDAVDARKKAERLIFDEFIEDFERKMSVEG